MVTALFDFSQMPRLESDRLVLREVNRKSDLSAMYELFSDPAVAEFTDTGPFTSMSEADEVLAWIDAIFHERQGMRWAITMRGTEVLIGTAGYNRWHRWNNSAEIGYDLRRDLWGRGLVTEAVATMLDFGFDQMALNRVEADVTVGNDGSARVLEKLGFVEEGLLRERGYWRQQYHDLRFFGLLRTDWMQRRTARISSPGPKRDPS